jgi:Tfp pilus assembly protein PilX
MKIIRNQRGATLFVALIFLLIMTLFAITSINMSTVNLRIVGNMQAVKYMDSAAQEAIEQKISSSDSFASSVGATTVTSTISGTNFTVNVAAPDCIDSQVAAGYSAVVENIIPEDNTWEISATVTDNVTGATSTIHQGVEMRMLAGNCG